MYAIVDIKGKQFKVEKDQELLVPKINKEIGSKIEFDKILLTNDDGEISTKSSLKITAEVLSHEKGDKVLVFKMKRRKGYQKKNGHKQNYTKIKIQNLGSVTKKVAPKKTTVKKTTAKKVVEKK